MDKATICINEVLNYEGGYVKHPNDPGGETNYGLSDRADGVIDGKYQGREIVTLSRADAFAEYMEDYWLPSGAEDLEFPLAACVFDTSVNMGLTKAKRFLKESEGHWGRYLELRTLSYLNLIAHNPKLKVFQNGWMNRINKLKTFILAHQNDQ